MDRSGDTVEGEDLLAYDIFLLLLRGDEYSVPIGGAATEGVLPELVGGSVYRGGPARVSGGLMLQRGSCHS